MYIFSYCHLKFEPPKPTASITFTSVDPPSLPKTYTVIFCEGISAEGIYFWGFKMKNCINNSSDNTSQFQYFCQVAVKMVWKNSTWPMAPMGGSRQRGGILSTQHDSTKCAIHKMDFLWWLSLNMKKHN